MAAFYTLEQLRERLQPIVHRELVFPDALNELGERAYALGRWPESTEEITIASANIYQNTDSGEEYEDDWFVDIDATLYDGAIAFRVEGVGYEVAPKSHLYEETETGWHKFIDMGFKDDSAGADELRTYKCPTGVTDSDNIQVWVKKRWIDLYDDADKYPIRSISAVKAGLLALGHEENNELASANALWQRFEDLLVRDEKQFHGPKKYKIGYDTPYNNHPRSFR